MNKSRSVSINDEVVLAISGARSAVKIFLFPVAKRAGTVHRGYTQAGRSKERVRFERPTGALYVPVRQEGSRRIVPRPTYTNLFTLSHDATLCVRTRSEPPRMRFSPRENPRVSWTVYWTSNTSCLARLVRGATYATIRPYTCNYFGQSVPVKSHASSYIYRPGLKVERHGIRCRFTTVRRLRFLGCCNLTRRLSFLSLWEEGGWDKFLI